MFVMSHRNVVEAGSGGKLVETITDQMPCLIHAGESMLEMSENARGWTNPASKTKMLLTQSSAVRSHWLFQNLGRQDSKSSSHEIHNFQK